MDDMKRTSSRVLYINASARMKGTSMMLIERIRSVVPGEIAHLYRESAQDLIQKMRDADTIVISGPCYINSYPGQLVRLLEAAAQDAPWQGQNLYGIINGGMPYIHTHRSGIAMLAIFAEQCGLLWQGGFVLGGGAMLDGQPLEKHLSRKTVVPAFDAFIQAIQRGEPSPDALYEDAQTPPGWLMTHLYARLLSFMVNRKIRKHGFDPHTRRKLSEGS